MLERLSKSLSLMLRRAHEVTEFKLPVECVVFGHSALQSHWNLINSCWGFKRTKRHHENTKKFPKSLTHDPKSYNPLLIPCALSDVVLLRHAWVSYGETWRRTDSQNAIRSSRVKHWLCLIIYLADYLVSTTSSLAWPNNAAGVCDIQNAV